MPDKLKIHIILGSTREGRQGDKVAKWLQGILTKHSELDTELLDLRDWLLPHYDEKGGPKMLQGNYKTPRAKEWAEKVGEADGFIILTPEYNHGYPSVLKNVLDYAYDEWNNKPVAFVSYGGSSGGVRAVEQLRLVSIELQMAPIREEINISRVWEAFDEEGQPKNEILSKRVDILLDQLIWWAWPLKLAREKKLPKCSEQGEV